MARFGCHLGTDGRPPFEQNERTAPIGIHFRNIKQRPPSLFCLPFQYAAALFSNKKKGRGCNIKKKNAAPSLFWVPFQYVAAVFSNRKKKGGTVIHSRTRALCSTQGWILLWTEPKAVGQSQSLWDLIRLVERRPRDSLSCARHS
jgi:hypothetical protein